MPPREGTYGLLAEFDTPGDLVRAARKAYADGWRRMDCYTPYPVEEAAEAIGFHTNRVPLLCLIGALMGLAAMFSLETWVSVIYCVQVQLPQKGRKNRHDFRWIGTVDVEIHVRKSG